MDFHMCTSTGVQSNQRFEWTTFHVYRNGMVFLKWSIPSDLHRWQKAYRSDVGEKSSTRSRDLIRHRWAHTGEKKVKNHTCSMMTVREKSFTRSGDLIRHRWTHTCENPYYILAMCTASLSPIPAKYNGASVDLHRWKNHKYPRDECEES